MTETNQLNAFIDGRSVAFSEGETILEAARRAGAYVPTLCEFAPLGHRPGTCRMCLVSVTKAGEAEPRLATACDTRLEPGMAVRTNVRAVRDARRLQAELLFADHCETCSSCARHGSCELQAAAAAAGLDLSALSGKLSARSPKIDATKALRYAADKCMRCLRCVEACREVQGVGAITFEGAGAHAAVGFDGRPWAQSDRCIQCGQCTLVCPTGALAERDQTDQAMDWLEDDAVITIFQIAPASRLALAEVLGLEPGLNLEGQIAAGLKSAGADFVMDTRWSADVTILEEGTELLGRLRRQKESGSLDHPDTMFTSCCPGWINHVEKSAPDMIPHVSTTRSPQAIFSALAKTYLPKELGLDAKRLRVISIMPCTAKKDEADRPLLRHDGANDTDLVLTVRELGRLFARLGIDLRSIEPQPFDSPFMTAGSGAAQLFATTGGVMEAALRTVCALSGGVQPPNLVYTPIRGLANAKEAAVETAEFGTLRVAVVYGIRNVQPFLEAVREGKSPYHFIEVMACPGGCIGGGGTARGKFRTTLPERQAAVYRIDRQLPVRCSHENPDVIRLYERYLGEPGSHLAHELLHCTYEDRRQAKPRPTFRKLEADLELA